jgi:hypothetical protein
MFVQGRVDASLMWAIEVEDFLSNELKLIAKNRADPCVYSGIVNGHPVILGRATDDFLCACESVETYDHIVVAQFHTKWKIHSLGIVRAFFGLNFVITEHCITIDQTVKCKNIISQVFGPSWRLQKPKGTHNIPMKAGTKYAELLARSPPLSDESLLATEESFGFKYRSVLGTCVHIAIWTRLDILLACVVLAQFQTSTGIEHFEALKHLVGYLRCNPDIPLTYCRKQFDSSVSFLDIEINEIYPLQSKIFSSNSYHVRSVDLISRTGELTIASALLFETEEARQVLPGAIRQDTLPFLPDESTVDQDITDFPESVNNPIDQLPRPSGLPRSAPFTESFVDANLPGGIYEKTPFLGFSIEMAAFSHYAAKRTLQQAILLNLKWMLLIEVEKAYAGGVFTWMILDYLSKLPSPRLKAIPLLHKLLCTLEISPGTPGTSL